MRTRFVGSALQVLGVVLIGLGVVTCSGTYALSPSYPTVPFWLLMVCGCVLGLPPIFVGGFLHARGTLLRGTASAQLRQQFHEIVPVIRVARFVWPLTWGAAAPVFVRAAGFADLGPTFLLGWAVGWVLVFGAGLWTVKALWPRIERRLAKRRGTYDLKPPRL